MKKFYAWGLVLFFCALGAQSLYAINLNRVDQILRERRPARQLFKLAQSGDVEGLHSLLTHVDKTVLLQKDSLTGNNVFHEVRDVETFAFFWDNISEQDREKLLTQKNNAGETPFMRQLSYNNPVAVLVYFPQTKLYGQMRNTTQNLQRGGVNVMVAQTSREEMIRLGSNNAGMTLWQMADMWGQQKDNPQAVAMLEVRDMIGNVAPFLKK